MTNIATHYVYRYSGILLFILLLFRSNLNVWFRAVPKQLKVNPEQAVQSELLPMRQLLEVLLRPPVRVRHGVPPEAAGRGREGVAEAGDVDHVGEVLVEGLHLADDIVVNVAVGTSEDAQMHSVHIRTGKETTYLASTMCFFTILTGN